MHNFHVSLRTGRWTAGGRAEAESGEGGAQQPWANWATKAAEGKSRATASSKRRTHL